MKNIGENNLLNEVIVINIGLDEFFNSLKKQKTNVTQVRWFPQAGGDKQMMKLLDELL